MAEMISVREATVRRVATLCKDGRIANAKKRGNRRLISVDTQKSADHRLKADTFHKTKRAPKVPFSISVSNYCLASPEYYYTDKTMMIKDFNDKCPMATMFSPASSLQQNAAYGYAAHLLWKKRREYFRLFP